MNLNRQQINAIVEKTYSIIKQEVDEYNNSLKEEFINKYRNEVEKEISRYKTILNQESDINYINFNILKRSFTIYKYENNVQFDYKKILEDCYKNKYYNNDKIIKPTLKEDIKTELILSSILVNTDDDLTNLIDNLKNKFI